MTQRLTITWLIILTIAAGYGFVFAAQLDQVVEDQAALKVQLTGLDERNRIEHEEFRSALGN